MTILKYNKYLGIKHDYFNNNCITLINDIYLNELNSNMFETIWEFTGTKRGIPPDGKNWKKRISIKNINDWAETIATKVNLTNIQEYDVILFKSGRIVPTHFGMYITSNRFIHLEEGKYSKIDQLTDYWREQIDSIWRWNGLLNT